MATSHARRTFLKAGLALTAAGLSLLRAPWPPSVLPATASSFTNGAPSPRSKTNRAANWPASTSTTSRSPSSSTTSIRSSSAGRCCRACTGSTAAKGPRGIIRRSRCGWKRPSSTSIRQLASATPLRIDVSVRFQRGWLTEFYPKAHAEAPGLKDGQFDFGKLSPRNDQQPGLERPASSAAKGVVPETTSTSGSPRGRCEAANVTNVDGESERYLFYRGVGQIRNSAAGDDGPQGRDASPCTPTSTKC